MAGRETLEPAVHGIGDTPSQRLRSVQRVLGAGRCDLDKIISTKGVRNEPPRTAFNRFPAKVAGDPRTNSGRVHSRLRRWQRTARAYHPRENALDLGIGRAAVIDP